MKATSTFNKEAFKLYAIKHGFAESTAENYKHVAQRLLNYSHKHNLPIDSNLGSVYVKSTGHINNGYMAVARLLASYISTDPIQCSSRRSKYSKYPFPPNATGTIRSLELENNRLRSALKLCKTALHCIDDLIL